jgi:hypothetical protein
MNRTAGSTEIGTAALLRRCARRVCADITFAARIYFAARRAASRSAGRRIGLTIMLLLASEQLRAEPAHFWISPSNLAPAGPEAPAIPGVNGNVRFLNIWAQPATDLPGAWNATSNPFKQLENFSLDLVINSASAEFLDNSFVVHNPRLGAGRRFEFVHDSSTGLASSSSLPDRITGVQAFSISTAGGFTGIGPACHPDDPFCGVTPSGAPAWLVATVAARTTADAGSVNFHLQIGKSGMNHEGELSSQTSVVFGNAGDPIYNAGCTVNPTQCADRQVTLSGDSADFVLQAVPSSAAQAMHWQAATGQWSSHSWSIAGRAPSWTDNAFLDATLGQNVVTVTGVQQANHTTVNGGRLHITNDSSLASEVVVNAGGTISLESDSSLASEVVVNAGGTISGGGWIASNLTLRGDLAASGAQPLKVSGRADIAGGALKLLDSYTQAPNTISAPFVVLEALGGIDGDLTTLVDSQLGDGLFLESIDYDTDPTRIFVQIKSVLVGDYNDDGSVDAADYVVWRKSDGTPQGYNEWRANFGRAVATASASATATVPEPATMAMVLLTLMLIIGPAVRRA